MPLSWQCQQFRSNRPGAVGGERFVIGKCGRWRILPENVGKTFREQSQRKKAIFFILQQTASSFNVAERFSHETEGVSFFAVDSRRVLVFLCSGSCSYRSVGGGNRHEPPKYPPPIMMWFPRLWFEHKFDHCLTIVWPVVCKFVRCERLQIPSGHVTTNYHHVAACVLVRIGRKHAFAQTQKTTPRRYS